LPYFGIVHAAYFGDLPDRILAGDITEYLPFFARQLGLLQLVRWGGVGEFQPEIEIRQFVDQPFGIGVDPSPFADHFPQINGHRDPVVGRLFPFLEREWLFVPGHHIVDNAQRLLLNALHYFVLGDIVGIDQQQRQGPVAVIGRFLTDDPVLFIGQLAGFMQHR
jgi:hypothetical protein